MSARLGRITARLAEPLTAVPADLIDRINRNIGPPAPVRAGDVYIRAMFIVSDQVNSFGGCFPVDEHGHLAELLIDSPVLVGHRKDKLPVARTFHASTTEQDGEHWVKAYFYWLRSAAGAEDLRENIDGGIYKECSIGFTFALAECSICGRDIRLCEHEPFQTYTVEGAEQACHFRYRRIERVLESSLVYRGATPDTHITRELQIKTSPDNEIAAHSLVELTDLKSLPADSAYLIMPRYESLPCTVSRTGETIRVHDADGAAIDHAQLRAPLQRLHLAGKTWEALLVGYRGKERCVVGELERFLDGHLSAVRRLVLYLVPPDQGAADRLHLEPNAHVRLMPHRFTSRDGILRCAREITSREGVEIRELENAPSRSCRYRAHPDRLASLSPDRFRLSTRSESGRGVLSLSAGDLAATFVIHHFNRLRLDHGTRFLADPVPPETTVPDSSGITGDILGIERRDDALLVTLGDPVGRKIVVRPITINARRRFLIYRAASEGGRSHVA